MTTDRSKASADISIDYETRPYKSSDDEQIVELLQEVFRGWPRININVSPLEHWRWKYDNKFLKDKLIAVAQKDDKIIGVLHAVPLKIKINEKIVSANLGADAAVHPDYRRMGVRNSISPLIHGMRRLAGIKLLIATSTNPITIKILSRKRFSFPFSMVNLTRIGDIDKQLREMPMKNQRIMKWGFHFARMLNKVSNAFGVMAHDGHVLNVSRLDGFDERADVFWKEVSAHYDYIIVRDGDFLNWRFSDPRAGDFSIRCVEDGERLLGYCVLKINRARESYPIGYIVDLLALPSRLDIVDSLLSDAVDFFDGKNVNIINCLMIRGHPYVKSLQRHGFLDSRMRIRLFYTDLGLGEGLSDEISRLEDADKIHISYGDFDSLPVSVPRVH